MRNETRFGGHFVAFPKKITSELKDLVEDLVFVQQVDAEKARIIRVKTYAHARIEQAADRVIDNMGHGLRDPVARDTDLECHLIADKLAEQLGIFNAHDPVTDTSGSEEVDRIVDVLDGNRLRNLAGVNGDGKSIIS